ncbi:MULTISPECIES: zf-HC2 domain-containing protein [unclassified Modestobacter]|uniref:zf-HC2 domain-containing protein n=1 Tax=unclassified Modestobacter TaxID=2643866 RepID=UPI0022AB4D0E|nr:MULTISPECIES: zf-HC2 domain-containing protein [unclassified Modestobacter]MCZ2826841.1 zf-HC2 domain-containing protein [Modestobacter sp. VKM Ac-2981]MCZ2855221.1 zf-HC2 domain-containing protein [Modestobacter sp. VKM Ac-2982]
MNEEQAHRALREELGVYALGAGSPEERAVVRAHLEGCAACRAELAELAPIAARLADADPDRLDEDPAPPAGLADAVLARIAAEDTLPRADPTGRRRRTRLAAGALVLATAAAAFAAGWLVRPVPPPPPLESVAVEVTDPDITATADVVPHTWGVEVKLAGAGFTAGEVYRVAVLEDGGDAAPAGAFLGTGPAELFCNLNSPVLRADAEGFQVVDASGAVVLRSTF